MAVALLSGAPPAAVCLEWQGYTVDVLQELEMVPHADFLFPVVICGIARKDFPLRLQYVNKCL